METLVWTDLSTAYWAARRLRTSCREAAAWIGRVGSDTAGDDDDDDDDDGLKDFRQKLFASIRIYPFI